jgi:hypothetical protein
MTTQKNLYIEELSLYFKKEVTPEFINFCFNCIKEEYYLLKKEYIRDYNLKVFNSLEKTKKLKSLIKLCLKENKSLKYFWGGF